MSELKRIDPKAVPELFRKHGMRPLQRAFCEFKHGVQCCCVNTILVAEVIGVDLAIDKTEGLEDYLNAKGLAPFSDIDPAYAVGLAEGWDGSIICRAGRTESELAGMEDGRAAWEACQELLQEVPR